MAEAVINLLYFPKGYASVFWGQAAYLMGKAVTWHLVLCHNRLEAASFYVNKGLALLEERNKGVLCLKHFHEGKKFQIQCCCGNLQKNEINHPSAVFGGGCDEALIIRVLCDSLNDQLGTKNNNSVPRKSRL